MSVATAIMVAKTGLDVYRMVKGGGGGGEGLVITQTEMLRSISSQIAVVNDGIQTIIEGVEGLKSLVRALPSEVVREATKSDVQAAFVNISEKLDRLAMLRERFGQSHALEQVKLEVALNLGRLEHSRAVLMGDVSPLTAPLVCAAWYVEFQALASLVPFERERILSVARSYARWAARIAPTLESLVSETAKEARALAAAAKWLHDPRNSPTCCLPITQRMVSAVLQQWSSTKFVVRYRAEPDEDPKFALHFDELQLAAVPVALELRALRRTTFDFEEQPTEILQVREPGGPASTQNNHASFQAWRRSVEQHPKCPVPKAFAKPKADQLDRDSDVVRERALMHYHFYLAHREARKSVACVIERLSRPR